MEEVEKESMGSRIDLTGKRFGRLTAIKDTKKIKGSCVVWLCKCECGRSIEVISASLLSGNTKSCGCLAREITEKRNTIHSLSRDKDGKRTRLYGIWVRMRQRCKDKNLKDYARYGGRGIKVCKEWSNYKNFYDWALANGYRANLSIDRKDNDGDYEPSNCKWSTLIEQAHNKSNNRLITYCGKTKTLAEWSSTLSIDRKTLSYRLKIGWSIEKAFTTPVRRSKNAFTKSKTA